MLFYSTVDEMAKVGTAYVVLNELFGRAFFTRLSTCLSLTIIQKNVDERSRNNSVRAHMHMDLCDCVETTAPFI
jgi:hypothetical protein